MYEFGPILAPSLMIDAPLIMVFAPTSTSLSSKTSSPIKTLVGFSIVTPWFNQCLLILL